MSRPRMTVFPKLRQARGPRPGTEPSPSRPAEPGTPAESGRSSLRWLVPTGLALAVAIGWMMWGTGALSDDPRWVEAQARLARYERVRAEAERNYTNPVYAEVLRLLGEVDRTSKSWDPAQSLAQQLRERIADFQARLARAERERAENQSTREMRREELLVAHRRSAQNPVTKFPECEHENSRSGHLHKKGAGGENDHDD